MTKAKTQPPAPDDETIATSTAVDETQETGEALEQQETAVKEPERPEEPVAGAAPSVEPEKPPLVIVVPNPDHTGPRGRP